MWHSSPVSRPSIFEFAGGEAGLPEDPELRAALRSYMEWAVRDVFGYEPSDPRLATDLPVPHWSWYGLRT